MSGRDPGGRPAGSVSPRRRGGSVDTFKAAMNSQLLGIHSAKEPFEQAKLSPRLVQTSGWRVDTWLLRSDYGMLVLSTYCLYDGARLSTAVSSVVECQDMGDAMREPL